MYPSNNKVIKQQAKFASWFFFTFFVFVFLFTNAYIASPRFEGEAAVLLAVEGDYDNDGVPDSRDNCPLVANRGQSASDPARYGNDCTNLISTTYDSDGDGIEDSQDRCPTIADSSNRLSPEEDPNCGKIPLHNANDADKDGVANSRDNCPLQSNSDQSDADGDGLGDACDDSDSGPGTATWCAQAQATCEEDSSDPAAFRQCMNDLGCGTLGGDGNPPSGSTGDDGNPPSGSTGDDGNPATGSTGGTRSVTVITLTNPLKAETVQDLILAVVKTLLKLAIPIAVLFIIWSGFKFVMAQGKPEAITKAIKTFQWTIIGLAVIFGAYVIATIIKSTIDTFY